MLQDFVGLLSGVDRPTLVALAAAGVVLVSGGILFLLLSGGVHFAGFKPPDPTRFPNAPVNLRRVGFGLLIIGLPTILASAIIGWWRPDPLSSLSAELKASQAELETLSQQVQAQQSEITKLNQRLQLEQERRQISESMLSEAEQEINRYREKPADTRETIEAEYANRIAELSGSVTALQQEKGKLEQKNSALRKEKQELAEELSQKIAELDRAVADAVESRNKTPGDKGGEVGADRDQNVFAEIDQNAEEYIPLLLHQSRGKYFDPGVAIIYIAYAISNDLHFIAGGTGVPSDLYEKSAKIMEHYGNLGYLLVRGERAGADFNRFYAISQSGVLFFQPVVDNYRSNDEFSDFLERLKTAQ